MHYKYQVTAKNESHSQFFVIHYHGNSLYKALYVFASLKLTKEYQVRFEWRN